VAPGLVAAGIVIGRLAVGAGTDARSMESLVLGLARGALLLGIGFHP